MRLKEAFEGKSGNWIQLPGRFVRRSDGLKCFMAIGDDGDYYMNWAMDRWLGPFSMIDVFTQFRPVPEADPVKFNTGFVSCSEGG